MRRGHRLIAGVDEVGRGALAGPVSVGVVLVEAGVPPAPRGVRDSKALTPRQRSALVPAIRRWAHASSVGHAEAWEIDEVGIVTALRLALERALMLLVEPPDAIVLDGPVDYTGASMPVFTRAGADRRCSTVAAASVLAKVTRDELMTNRDLAHPGYDWAANKGYGSPRHLQALASLGVTGEHRVSWRLTGAASPVDP